ncbi:uncharacterized protein LOC135349282 isoform X2 [Halichondria panicea]|uniref:uncharacterized protein LOC135349282 isoform X2 n=1 Tax=Halichondria panicea TaxID=6063 RepID=UPI00312BA9D1
MIVYTQSLHLSAMAEVAMDAVDAADGKVEFMITGVTDAAIMDSSAIQFFIAEGKCNAEKKSSGEGQLWVGALISLLKVKCQHPIWGIVLRFGMAKIIRVWLDGITIRTKVAFLNDMVSLKDYQAVFAASYYAIKAKLGESTPGFVQLP